MDPPYVPFPVPPRPKRHRWSLSRRTNQDGRPNDPRSHRLTHITDVITSVVKSKTSPWSVPYFTGAVLDMVGSCIAVGGLLSTEWMMVTSGHTNGCGGSHVSGDVTCDKVANVGDGMVKAVYHFGPLQACADEARCQQPWDIVPGLTESSVQWTQLSVSVAIIFYLSSVVAMVAKCITTKMDVVAGFNRKPFLEVISSIACIACLLFLLLMGELKRSIILHHGETLTLGHGFFLTLVSLLLSATGILLLFLSRYKPRIKRVHFKAESNRVRRHRDGQKSTPSGNRGRESRATTGGVGGDIGPVSPSRHADGIPISVIMNTFVFSPLPDSIALTDSKINTEPEQDTSTDQSELNSVEVEGQLQRETATVTVQQ